MRESRCSRPLSLRHASFPGLSAETLDSAPLTPVVFWYFESLYPVYGGSDKLRALAVASLCEDNLNLPGAARRIKEAWPATVAPTAN